MNSKVSKKSVTSQRQADLKLLEKKNKDKRYISNWKPISLLNVEYKIISKSFASRLKKSNSKSHLNSINRLCCTMVY